MRLAAALALVTVVVLAALAPVAAPAQETRLEVQSADTVKSVLERQVGKRVGLVLTTGPELTGVVTRVGDTVVHLPELSGRDLLDAVIGLDRISAVVIRVRGVEAAWIPLAQEQGPERRDGIAQVQLVVEVRVSALKRRRTVGAPEIAAR